MSIRYNKMAFLLVIVILITVTVLFQGLPIARSTNGMAAVSTPEPAAEVLLPGEAFIKGHMLNSDGTIKTNLKNRASNNPDFAQGNESLSESMGLWLMYAFEKGDKALFKQNVDVLTAKFLKTDGWVYWKVGSAGKRADEASTNALIDDLRIAEALYNAAEKWNVPEWRKLADTIAMSLSQRQVVNNLFTDFYDIKSKWASDELTLSYINVAALATMYEQEKITDDMYEQMRDFLDELPVKKGFFPFSYQTSKGTYKYDSEINMIDQMYIVYHRALAGMESPDVWAFIQKEFEDRGLLYGRYHADTKKPAVEFESPAVYALAILTAIELEDEAFAQDLYYRMVRDQTRNPKNELYGGYLDGKDTHIFDNLLPLLAERKMFNEGYLQ